MVAAGEGCAAGERDPSTGVGSPVTAVFSALANGSSACFALRPTSAAKPIAGTSVFRTVAPAAAGNPPTW
ncbi:hypothetical protein RZS08_07805 [Arthrospira platensis SPKY1]|nr:hypothetical protein [Arthrospira platensis SPKY1]